jgi:hypothetical protein
VFIYVPALSREHSDYGDYKEAQRAGDAFLLKLMPGSAWEFDGQQLYEAQMSSRELVACEMEIKKFATRRFS